MDVEQHLMSFIDAFVVPGRRDRVAMLYRTEVRMRAQQAQRSSSIWTSASVGRSMATSASTYLPKVFSTTLGMSRRSLL
jgi:hypothetical protein